MSIFCYVGNAVVDVSRIRLRANGDQGIAGLSQAADGTGSLGAITFEDPTYDLTTQGWTAVAVDEPDSSPNSRLFSGYIATQVYGRGSHYLTSSQRQIDVTIADTNVLLSNQLILAADSPNRPAETDTARLSWLLGTAPMTGKVYDLGLVNPIGLGYDATDFTHQTPWDVLNDLCSPRGNIFFTYWNQTSKKVGLYYDTPISTAFTCTLTFSNVLSDITFTAGEPSGTCFPAFPDNSMDSEPGEVYCQVIYKYAGGQFVAHDATTHTTFFQSTTQGVPATSHRAIAVENLRVGKLSTAQSFAFRLLEHYSVERRTVSFTTRLPSTKIGLLQAGMRVGLRFIELPDISTLQYYRIETLTVAPTDGDPTHYDAQVTASVHGLGFAPGTGGGSTTPFPHQPPAGASIVQTGCGSAIGGAIPVTFPAPVTVGSTIVVAAVWRDGTTSTTADTNNGGTPNLVTFTLVDRVTLNGVATEDAVMMYRVVTEDDLAAGPGTTYTFGAGAGTGRPQSMGWELAGVTAPTASVRIDNATGTSYSFPSLTISGAGIAIGMSGLGSDNPAPATFTPSDHFYLESTGGFWQTLIGMDQLRTAAGSQVYSATFTVSGGGNQHDGIVAFFPTDSASSAPLPGQWSEWKTITMAGAVGDLGFPYASGSLQIKVDSVLISAASYTENNTAGTFTLSWITDTDETVTARAQGI